MMPPTTMQSKAMLRSGADDVGRRQIMDKCVPTTMQSEAMGRSGDDDHAGSADPNAPHLHHRVGGARFAAGEAVRFDDGDDIVDARKEEERLLLDGELVADDPDDGAFDALRDVRSETRLLDLADDFVELGLRRRGFEDDDHDCTNRENPARTGRGFRLLPVAGERVISPH